MTPATPLLPSPPAAAGPATAGKAAGGRTAARKPGGALSIAGSASEVSVPLAVLGIVLAMIAPLPPFLLDILLSANITISVIVLLVSMYITRPVEFSVFPTALLLMTLFRLALNISSSRLILLNGSAGTAAAGDVIEAFGSFVVGGNYVIGVVIFLVLIAIQYVVINHGAVRISEVTARFTLDAMPGKQMSIDSDLNAGLIDEAEARNRRKQLAAEAEFYGAMDGASRFTQRDAVASIIITAINIVAGFLVGVLQNGMELKRALQTYTVLTIGDGLVTVIPALMVSVCGGLIVTRASSDNRLGPDVKRQVFGNPQPLMLASGILLAMAAFPGLPKIPFIVMAAGTGYAAWQLRQKIAATAETAPSAQPGAASKDAIEPLLRVEPLAVEVGLGLIGLVEGGQNSPVLRRIGAIRRQIAADLGYVLPPVRVADNVSLKPREYSIVLKGVELSRFEMPQGRELAIHPSKKDARMEGVPAREPAFGLTAYWIAPDQADTARQTGFTVVDPVSVMGTHLAEEIRRNAHELFSRQDAKRFLDRAAEDHPKAVEDLVPKLLPLAVVHKVLQNLLRERVSIRDGGTILESLGEAAALTRNPVLLTEYSRQAIRRMLAKPYLNPSGDLIAYFLDPSVEREFEAAIEHSEHASHVNLNPERIRQFVEAVSRATGGPESSAVLLAGSMSRYFVRQTLESSMPNLAVLSHSEIPAGVKVISMGVVR